MAVALAATCAVCVLALVVTKVVSPVLEAVPWSEVFYGPALTAGSALALACLGASVQVGRGRA
jgi:hypothetical protein